MKLLQVPCLIAFSLVFVASSLAQESETEDVFELSPFAIDDVNAGGYMGSSTLSGSRLKTGLKDLGSAITVVTDEYLRDVTAAQPTVPITLVKPADEVRIRFAISFYDDLQSVRESTLQSLLDQAQAAVDTNERLRFEPERMMIAQGDRKHSLRKRRSEFTSHDDSFDPRPDAKAVGKVNHGS